jgi:hypothetical protein
MIVATATVSSRVIVAVKRDTITSRNCEPDAATKEQTDQEH